MSQFRYLPLIMAVATFLGPVLVRADNGMDLSMDGAMNLSTSRCARIYTLRQGILSGSWDGYR